MADEEVFVDQSIERNGRFLLPVLQDIQGEYNYLPEKVLEYVAKRMEIPLRDVYGVATFYRSFSLTPKGDNIVTVCLGTACHVRAGARIAEALAKELGIRPGETTDDMQFSLETVNCLGCCAIGPIVEANGEYHGQMTPQKAIGLVRALRSKS